MTNLKINLRCNRSCVGPVCQKKLHFIASLPFDVVQNLQIAVKMATVKLCASCPFRMFVLPNYALSPTKIAKYELLWKNRDIISALLDGKPQYAEAMVQRNSKKRSKNV